MAKKISVFSLLQMGNTDGRGIPVRVIIFTSRIPKESIFSRRLSQVIVSDINNISFSYGLNDIYFKLVRFWCLHEIVTYSTTTVITISGQSS
jgi:hypothetical protein